MNSLFTKKPFIFNGCEVVQSCTRKISHDARVRALRAYIEKTVHKCTNAQNKPLYIYLIEKYNKIGSRFCERFVKL